MLVAGSVALAYPGEPGGCIGRTPYARLPSDARVSDSRSDAGRGSGPDSLRHAGTTDMELASKSGLSA